MNDALERLKPLGFQAALCFELGLALGVMKHWEISEELLQMDCVWLEAPQTSHFETGFDGNVVGKPS